MEAFIHDAVTKELPGWSAYPPANPRELALIVLARLLE
jgi:hypothetical protein